MAKKQYQDLGVYSDLVTAAHKAHALFPEAKPGKKTMRQFLDWLGFDPGPAEPKQLRVERRWERDGIVGEALSWSVGYGPRTEAWYLRPAGVSGPLPGVVALHDHGGFKYLGKEKIAFGPDEPTKLQTDWVTRVYGGRAFANDLARLGFAVLVPDVFTWGSRRFPMETMTDWDKQIGSALHAQGPMESNPPDLMPEEISRYCWTAVAAEHTVQKYCNVLGTSMAGVIAYEDRVAAAYLAGRKDEKPGGVGCVGLSGGGLRAGLLQGTSPQIRASVVVGLMSTYDALLDHNVVSHTWMLYPGPELARGADWTDVVACRAPSPLMVQFDKEDALFTPEGMKAADRRLRQRYTEAGKPKNFVGEFYPGPHKFDRPMQDSAFAWLKKNLA